MISLRDTETPSFPTLTILGVVGAMLSTVAAFFYVRKQRKAFDAGVGCVSDQWLADRIREEGKR